VRYGVVLGKNGVDVTHTEMAHRLGREASGEVVKICQWLELQAGARRIQENPSSRIKKTTADADAFHKMLVSFGSLS